MLIIKLDEKTNIEKALKQYKRKVINTKQVKKLRDQQYYIKPSAKKAPKITKSQILRK